jgi:hypothetical protein
MAAWEQAPVVGGSWSDAPIVPAVTMPDEKQRLENAYQEMAARNSFGGNVKDGMANAIQRYILGGKSVVGAATEADKAELAAAEKAYGSTVGGKIGDIVGTAAPAVAATFLPRGNTIGGQAIIGSAMGFAQPADSVVTRAMNTGLGAIIGGVSKAGGDKLANFLAGRNAAGSAAVQANAVRDATIREAQAAGYTIPPASSNPTVVNRALEGMAGKISTAQGAAIKNQPVTDALARKALGLSDDVPLTRETLVGVRRQAGQAYAAVANTGEIVPTHAYDDALEAIVKPFKTSAAGFPNAKPNPIIAEIESLKTPRMDASAAVAKISELRGMADAAYAQNNKPLGGALKSAAAALEDVLDKHIQSINAPAELLRGFREARTLIAKTYSVEKALREGTGNISAAKIGAQFTKGKPLSGELETIGKFAQTFPRAAQDITSSMNGVSPLDFAVGGSVAGISGNPGYLAMIAGRPAVRSMILSRPYQQAFAGAPSREAGLLAQASLRALGGPEAPMVLTSGLLNALANQ